ncbi:hypothetical protein [Sphingobacterium suaedae]|uniref:Uncharacterized protein n=1 Tax=Sphingobacterium suaedae TaxID=1686402 RepID=A0ABW5KQT5_9SPHI
MNNDHKYDYNAPSIITVAIEMEQGIAAGSAIVKPENTNGQVYEEWKVLPDDSRTIDW